MIEELLNEAETFIETDSFEYEIELKLAQIEKMGVGIDAVTPILKIMERHPLDDFGMPGAMVHFVERFYKNGYEEKLVESLKRRPANHTIWMLNRIINGSEKKEEYRNLLKEIIERPDVEEEIKKSAQNFINYQSNQ